VLVEHTGPFREGEHLFREGDAFNAIAAVRAVRARSESAAGSRRSLSME
jgi:hypothetical protein